MTVPTPADTYAVIAARQRQQAIADVKRQLAGVVARHGNHDPLVDFYLDKLAALTREDT